MSDGHLRVGVIIGSVREQRFGTTVADWLVGQARQRGDLNLDVMDLREIELPAVIQNHPVVTGEYTTPEVERFAARIGAADGFVVITPEYNHSYPGSLKHAIDCVNPEWHAKPVGFVSYGGFAGGLRAVEHLRAVFAELHAMTIRETVSFYLAPMHFDEHGAPRDGENVNGAAKKLFDQLVWWAKALRDARARQPYTV
jgi:NAD(P)H-dependent FMN reductase